MNAYFFQFYLYLSIIYLHIFTFLCTYFAYLRLFLEHVISAFSAFFRAYNPFSSYKQKDEKKEDFPYSWITRPINWEVTMCLFLPDFSDMFCVFKAKSFRYHYSFCVHYVYTSESSFV